MGGDCRIQAGCTGLIALPPQKCQKQEGRRNSSILRESGEKSSLTSGLSCCAKPSLFTLQLLLELLLQLLLITPRPAPPGMCPGGLFWKEVLSGLNQDIFRGAISPSLKIWLVCLLAHPDKGRKPRQSCSPHSACPQMAWSGSRPLTSRPCCAFSAEQQTPHRGGGGGCPQSQTAAFLRLDLLIWFTKPFPKTRNLRHGRPPHPISS